LAVGVGVGVPLAVALVLAIAWALWERSRGTKVARKPVAGPAEIDGNDLAYYDAKNEAKQYGIVDGARVQIPHELQ
jgi:hypothetical protein